MTSTTLTHSDLHALHHKVEKHMHRPRGHNHNQFNPPAPPNQPVPLPFDCRTDYRTPLSANPSWDSASRWGAVKGEAVTGQVRIFPQPHYGVLYFFSSPNLVGFGLSVVLYPDDFKGAGQRVFLRRTQIGGSLAPTGPRDMCAYIEDGRVLTVFDRNAYGEVLSLEYMIQS